MLNFMNEIKSAKIKNKHTDDKANFKNAKSKDREFHEKVKSRILYAYRNYDERNLIMK